MTADGREVMERIAALAPVLASHAQACVEARRVVPESMAAMVKAQLFRITRPARAGGFELSLRVFGDAVGAVAEVCPSSAWILMVMGAHHFCLASWPEAAQDEVFGTPGEALVAGTLAWQGRARAVDGGYVVNGRWQFCSGVDNANWVMMGCADAESGAPAVHVVAPRAQVAVDDTWQVLGLEGTGSKDIIAEELFVPSYRAVDTRDLMRGSSPHALNHRSRVYRVSADAMLSLAVPAPLLGIARAMHASFIERTKQRRVIVTGARKAEHGPTQVRLAEAWAEIHAAELIVHDAQALMAWAAESEQTAATDMGYRARVKWQAAYAAELCRRAAARMYAAAGAHAVYNAGEIQRGYRDISVGAQHASIDFDSSAELYARQRLGLLSRPA
jgi:alkylation response protein AidB-like acyl-CoA dehydrogenase